MATSNPLPSAADLHRQVRDLIHRRKGIRPARLRPAARLGPELGFDAVDVVDLILELERTFRITIPDEAALHTVADLTRCVQQQCAA